MRGFVLRVSLIYVVSRNAKSITMISYFRQRRRSCWQCLRRMLWLLWLCCQSE